MRKLLTIGVVIVSALSAQGAHAADGYLDYNLRTPNPIPIHVGGNDILADVSVLSDGSIVMAGTIYKRGTATSIGPGDLAIARVKKDGTFDRTFSGDGRTTLNLGGDDNATAVAVSPNKSIVVAGVRFDGLERTGYVIRFTKTGARDKTFGSNGTVALTDPALDLDLLAQDIAVQRDGKILVAVTTYANAFGVGSLMPSGPGSVRRFMPDGTPDLSFGVNGQALVSPTPTLDYLDHIRLSSDGSMLVAGTSLALPSRLGDFTVSRLTADGALDPTFGTAGRATINAGDDDMLTGLGVGRNGTIVLGGNSGGAFAAVRLTKAGVLDPAFSSDGLAYVALSSRNASYSRSLLVQSDGAIIMVGSEIDTSYGFTWPRPTLVRFTSSGKRDMKFGIRGRAMVPRMWWVEELAMQGSKMIAAGWGYGTSGNDFFLARYLV